MQLLLDREKSVRDQIRSSLIILQSQAKKNSLVFSYRALLISSKYPIEFRISFYEKYKIILKIKIKNPHFIEFYNPKIRRARS